MTIIPDSSFDLNLNAARQALRFDPKEWATYLKKGALITSYTAAILSSAFLAWTNRMGWMKITGTVTLINLYALPKILHHGHAALIHHAISVNLACLGSLFLGGFAAATLSLNHTMMASLKTYQFSTALFCAFGITALLGYALPLSLGAIKKGYQFLTQPDRWKENFSNLREQFHRMPEMGLGIMQTNLWQNVILQMALIKPEIVLSFWPALFIHSPDYVWSMAAASSERITLEQFNKMLDHFVEASSLADISQEDLSDEIKDQYYHRLKIAMRGLTHEELNEAVAMLLEKGAKFIPHILSNEQFLELFVNDALDATNRAIEELLDQTAAWPDLVKRHTALEADISQLEDDVQGLQTAKEKDDFSVRLEDVKQEFLDLRSQAGNIYADKRTWQHFAPLWSNAQKLPFENADELLMCLHDQPLLDEIDTIHRSLIGNGQGKSNALSDRMQLITNKLLVATENVDAEEQPFSPIIFLATNYGFVQKDFEQMREWLNLDSLHEMEEELARMGLETEEDLYSQDIVQPQELLPKSDILDCLHLFIKNANKEKKLAGRVGDYQSIDHSKRAHQLGLMVTRTFYHATTSGLILVPLLIHPCAALSGFVAGSAVFILKRFGVQKAIDIVHLCHETIKAIPLGGFVRDLIGRRVFSLTPRRREAANQFCSADFFGRMRLINMQMIAAIFISSISIRMEKAFLGSFLQGVAFAHEVVDLV